MVQLNRIDILLRTEHSRRTVVSDNPIVMFTFKRHKFRLVRIPGKEKVKADVSV